MDRLASVCGGRTHRCLDGQAVEGQANVESCIREYIRAACRWKIGGRTNPGRNRRLERQTDKRREELLGRQQSCG